MINKREQIQRTCGLSHRGVSAALVLLALVGSSVVLPSRADGQSGQDGQALFQKRCTGCYALDADHENPASGVCWEEQRVRSTLSNIRKRSKTQSARGTRPNWTSG